MLIGVVGDTHGNYESLQAAVEQMGIIDCLLFVGDCVEEIELLQQKFPNLQIRGVRGNCDAYPSKYPNECLLNIEGHIIFITHGYQHGVKNGLIRLSFYAQEKKAEIALFGHTHIPSIDEWGGLKLVNPGALEGNRNDGKAGYALLDITPEAIGIELRNVERFC